MTRRELLAALLASPLVSRDLHPSTPQPVKPSGPQSLTALTIAQLQARYAAGTLEPRRVVDAYLARIEKLNADLNAYITVTRDFARREARALARDARARAPLYGIPIAHKDLFETRGVRTTAGSLLFETHTPDTNAVVVQQLESMGGIMLGKTNTHELGGGVTTSNPIFGATRHPADRTRIPGGSSGGSAAAVAAQLCAAATGSDTGGSVRIPAAFCGCVGFKPTHGLISTQGLIAASPTFDHVGFLTRTVEDAQIVLRAFGAPPDSAPLPGKVRVGIARNYFFEGLDPQVASVVEATLSSIKTRATVTDVTFPVTSTTMAQIFNPVFLFELWGRFGVDWRTNPGSFSKQFSAVFATGRPSVVEYEAGLAALKDYQALVDTLFNEVDVLITPTVPIVAPPLAGPIDGMKILRNTWPFNAAGTPAISVPVDVRRGGTSVSPASLPVGLQIVGRRGEDDKLLQVARTLSTNL